MFFFVEFESEARPGFGVDVDGRNLKASQCGRAFKSHTKVAVLKTRSHENVLVDITHELTKENLSIDSE